jgi:hypothetical protein
MDAGMIKARPAPALSMPGSVIAHRFPALSSVSGFFHLDFSSRFV